jgi:DNA-binding PadR family transcriptional regulator
MSDPTLLVLASLADGDKHGYAMMDDIERFAGVRLGPGTLYGAITRLEQQKWIRPVPSEDRRQPYTITSAGREFLAAQVERFSRVVKTASKRLKHA